MKLLKVLGIVLAVLVVLVLAAGYFFLGPIAAAAVEKGGAYALGVRTDVASANLGLLHGRFSMSGLEIGNPQGFSDENLLRIDSTSIEVSPASFLEDTIRSERLALDGVEMRLERKGLKTNFGALLENLERFEKKPKGRKAEEGGGKKLIIREVVIRDVRAHIDLIVGGGSNVAPTVTIPEIRLQNVGNAEGGASIAEISSALVAALIQATVEQGGGLIPAELMGELTGALERLADLDQGLRAIGAQIGKLGGKLGEGAVDVLEGAGKAIESVGKELKDVIDR